MGLDHLVCDRDLAALQMGRNCSGAVLHLGVIGDSAATCDYCDELGTVMTDQVLALPLLILWVSFVMAEGLPGNH